MNSFAILAQNFINALKYLEQPLQNLNKSSLREQNLQHCKEVFVKPMPLKDPIIKKVLFMIIHNFSDKRLLETEKISLLETLELLFQNYDNSVFKIFFSDEKEIGALLITQILSFFKVFFFYLFFVNLMFFFKDLNKNISLKAVNILNKCLDFLQKQELQNFFPKICSELFKVINKEYQVSSKTISMAIQSLEKLILKTLERRVCVKPDFVSRYKDLLSKKIQNSAKIENENEPFTRISEFFEILYRNLEKNKYNNRIAQSFMHLVLETIDIFIDTPCFRWILLTHLYFNNSSNEESENSINLLNKKLISQGSEKINEISSFLKEEFFINLKSLEKLLLCVDSQVFLKSFRILKNINQILNLQSNKHPDSFKDLVIFSYPELDTIFNTFFKAFSVRPMKTVKIETIDQFTNISLFKAADCDKNLIFSLEEMAFNFAKRKIIDCFEIMNFDENVFVVINEMFENMEISLAIHLFEICFNKLAEMLYSFENMGVVKEIITITFLANQFLSRFVKFSIFNRKWFDFLASKPKIHEEIEKILVKFIDLLLKLDYLPIEDMRDEISVFKVLFEILKIEGLCKSFLITPEKHKNNFLNKFNILYYLLEKYVENDALIKILIEKNLGYFICFIENEKNVSVFFNKYIENIIKRLILQIRSLHMLENKLQPFKVFEALLVIIQHDENSVSVFHSFCMDVWLTLIKLFDNFFILSEFRFIYLFLKITRHIMLILASKKEEIKQNDNENLKYNEINLIRQVLLRIKPLIVSKNSEIMVLANEIFKESLIIINGKFFFIFEFNNLK